MISARAKLLLPAVLVLAGCSSGHGSTAASSSPARSTSTPAGSASSAPKATAAQYYVSLGDSYAAGYQPTGTRVGHTTRNGFAYQVVDQAAARGRKLMLVNFGCAGATTASLLHQLGCRADYLGPGGAPYPGQTQAAAAEAFLRAHRGQVALVTISIGGNDLLSCGQAKNPVACTTTALGTVKANLSALLTGLRSATGTSTLIVGLTYPDILLDGQLSSNSAVRQLSVLSVTAFEALINPALKATYEAAGGQFVDVTTATGAYTPLTQTTVLRPYGRIPVAVADLCRLTYACQFDDIHPRTAGYALIAKLVVAKLG